MMIKRVDDYADPRFSETVLLQHGCFLVDDSPYEVEIITDSDAVIRGKDYHAFGNIIDEFRFYAPHITRFYSEDGQIIREFPPRKVFKLCLDLIQPSQFYVDQDKIAAISSFIEKPEDIIIQVLPYENRYISLDGHTRLYYAVMKGWRSVYAVAESSDDWVFMFVKHAIQRNIQTPMDMELVTHQEYEVKWNQFCDELFAERMD